MPLNHMQPSWCKLRTSKDQGLVCRGARPAGGYTPNFTFPVYRLCLGDQDVLHFTPGGKNVSSNRLADVGQQSDAEHGARVIDHIAFHATGLAEIIGHLEVTGTAFTERQVD